MNPTWVTKSGDNTDNKVHEANMGPIWGRQDPGGPHVGSMNLAIWEPYYMKAFCHYIFTTWFYNDSILPLKSISV